MSENRKLRKVLGQRGMKKATTGLDAVERRKILTLPGIRP
jgi:hypothetical protein